MKRKKANCCIKKEKNSTKYKSNFLQRKGHTCTQQRNKICIKISPKNEQRMKDLNESRIPNIKTKDRKTGTFGN